MADNEIIDYETIIKSSQTDPKTKDAAWSVVHSATDSKDLETKLRPLNLAPKIKDSLWNTWHYKNPKADFPSMKSTTPKEAQASMHAADPNLALQEADIPDFAKEYLEFSKGMGTTFGKHMYNAANLARSAFGLEPLAENKELIPPNTSAAKLGEFAADTSEYFIPGLGYGKPAKLFNKLSPIAKRMAQTTYEGLTGGAIGTIQTGSVEKGAGIGAFQAGMTGLLAPAISKTMEIAGSKIQLRQISPRALDYNAGFDPKILKTLDLKGNLRDSYDQVNSMIGFLGKKRADLLSKQSGGTPITIDLSKAFNEVEQKIKGQISSGAQAGQNRSIMQEFNKLKNDIYGALGANAKPVSIKPNVSLEYAENAKEALGTIGDFVHQMGKGAYIPPDATAKAEIADMLYLAIRNKINGALPKGSVQELNNKMAQLMPVRRAILKQIPVNDRQAAINAMDLWATVPALISGNASHLALLAAVKGQRYMRVGNYMARNAGTAEGTLKNFGKVAAGALGMNNEE